MTKEEIWPFEKLSLHLLVFWTLLVLSLSIVLPWLRLRKVAVEIKRPSSHVALAKFNYGVTPFAGSSMAISRDPLKEWHSFANVPSPNEEGFRLTISRGRQTGRGNSSTIYPRMFGSKGSLRPALEISINCLNGSFGWLRVAVSGPVYRIY